MKEEEPATKGPCPARGWATPFTSSVTVPDPTEAPVQVLEAVKNVNVTVPVGVPTVPLTVALSCTVDPAGTEVTPAWLALGISVATVGVSSVAEGGVDWRLPRKHPAAHTSRGLER